MNPCVNCYYEQTKECETAMSTCPFWIEWKKELKKWIAEVKKEKEKENDK
jgi:hypothetical protein